MKFVKQLSVFVENKSGRLSDVLNSLSEKNIDISALSIADTTDFGIVRMIVSDPDTAAKVLKENGIVVKITEVIALAVQDRPGGLAEVVSALKDAGVAIEYIYAFIGKSENSAMVIVKADDPIKAIQIMKETHHLVNPEDVYRL